jgi:eukaryotic-like serine/threonine-protein kinase
MSKYSLKALIAHQNGFITQEQLSAIQDDTAVGNGLHGAWDELEKGFSSELKDAIDVIVDESIRLNQNGEGTLDLFNLMGDESDNLSKEERAIAQTLAVEDDSIRDSGYDKTLGIEDSQSNSGYDETISIEDSATDAATAATMADSSHNSNPSNSSKGQRDLKRAGGTLQANCMPTYEFEVTTEHEGRYEVRKELGKGGIGRVLLGFDSHVGRNVAIKELLGADSMLKDPPGKKRRTRKIGESVNSRFLHEARVTGQLEHPSIIPVYEIGRRPKSGSLYYTMKLVKGQTLQGAIRNAASLQERLLLLPHFLDMCNAIAYANSKGVLHRDIKPGNIMLGEFGETVVLDWGLAKVKGTVENDSRFEKELENLKSIRSDTKTREGATLGTPAYMPPEQALGKISLMDGRSDIYSLGAVLYEILTGKPPVTGKYIADILMRVVNEEIKPVRELIPQVPIELEAIVAKALSKNMLDRYQKAQDLAADLEAYMSGNRITAHEYTSWELLKRFIQQNKALVISIASIAGVIILALILTLISYSKEKAAKKNMYAAMKTENAAKIRAVNSNKKMKTAIVKQQIEQRKAHFRIAQALMGKAKQSLKENAIAQVAIYSSASLMHNPANRLSPYFDKSFAQLYPESILLKALADGWVLFSSFNKPPDLVDQFYHLSTPNRVVVSKKGRYVALGLHDGSIKFIDRERGVTIIKRVHKKQIFAMALGPKGKKLVTGGDGSELVIWDMKKGKKLMSIAVMEERYHAISWDPEGKYLYVSTSSGYIDKYDINNINDVNGFGRQFGTVSALAVSFDGKYVATGSMKGVIIIRDSKTGEIISKMDTIKGGTVWGLDFNPKKNILVSGSFDGGLRFWQIPEGKLIKEIRGNGAALWSVAFSMDGKRVVTGGNDGKTRVWDAESITLQYSLGGHSDLVHGVAITADGREVFTAGYDKKTRVWRLPEKNGLVTIKGHKDIVLELQYSSDGKYLISGGNDFTTRVWEVKKGKNYSVLSNTLGLFKVFPGIKNRMVSLSQTGVSFYNIDSKIKANEFNADQMLLFSIGVSKNGERLATGSFDGTIKIWKRDGFIQLGILKGHKKKVNQMEFSKNGKLLFSASSDNTVRVWDLNTNKQVSLLQHNDWVTGLAISSDDKYLYTSGKSSVIKKWDISNKKSIQELKGHHQWVNRIVLSPDNKLLASSSDDGTVIVWSLPKGDPVLSFKTKVSVGLAFSPDGKNLAITDFDTIKIIPLNFSLLKSPPKGLLERFEKRSGLKLNGIMVKPSEKAKTNSTKQ